MSFFDEATAMREQAQTNQARLTANSRQLIHDYLSNLKDELHTDMRDKALEIYATSGCISDFIYCESRPMSAELPDFDDTIVIDYIRQCADVAFMQLAREMNGQHRLAEYRAVDHPASRVIPGYEIDVEYDSQATSDSWACHDPSPRTFRVTLWSRFTPPLQ